MKDREISMCRECNKRPIKYTGMGLCGTCYGRQWKAATKDRRVAARTLNGNICLCGCGHPCYQGRTKWIAGHRDAYRKSILTCLCGCGTPVPEQARYVKGHQEHPGMRGQKHTKETREQMSRSAKGKKKSDTHRMSIARALRRGGGGPQQRSRLIRRWAVYKEWRTAVFTRDDYTCQLCGSRAGGLQADHIIPFCARPDLILSVANGRTLCIGCHKKTPTYGEKAKKYRRSRHALALQLPLEVVIP